MDIFLKQHNISNDEFEYLSRISKTDYHNKPIPVLIQPSIGINIINKIEEYNLKNATNFGFNIGSILSLVQLKKTKTKDPKYKEEFQLDKNTHGSEYLKNIFNSIISDDPMTPSIMNEIEKTQSHFGNRKSDANNPMLFLMFLPMGNDINKLQQTMIKFLKKHKLWTDYYITYSNSKSKSDEDTKKYKKFVDKQLEVTKSNDKKGCILLLGNQGKMAYTYHECDVVIRLDNGTDIDDAEQVGYRCLTEGPITDNPDEQKTIGITVDLNIQRVYSVMRNKIKNYKKNNPDSKKTYGDIIQYMNDENQFIFNPNEFDFGNCTTEMVEYYKKYEDKLKSETLIETVICNIQCEDTLSEYIKQIKLNDGTYKSNPKVNGKQPDCPMGKKTKKKVDPVKVNNSDSNESLDEDDKDDEVEIDIFNDINKTKNLYEFLSKLCCLMLRIDYKNPNITSNVIELLKILKDNKKQFNIIKMKLIDDYDINEKDLNIIYKKYIEDMSNQNNIDILDDIFEIYSNSDPKVVRDIIGKHFIPSLEQKKKNAEIPTPPELCDEMISKIPIEYFMDENNKSFEPCCGKGNFVLAIFERYFDGLSHIEDECERCCVILEKCLYFCDIDPMNIYITEELLKCHALSKMKEEFWKDWNNVIQICDINFNSYVGDTLELNIQDTWNIEGFDAVIGNPPYEERDPITGKSKGGTNLYMKFINNLFVNIKENGFLVFITPITWLSPSSNKQMGGNILHNIFMKYDLLYLNLNECKKYFKKVGSTFSYYIISKSITKDLNTKIISQYNDEITESDINMKELSDFKFLPIHINKETINLILKIINNKNKIIINRCRKLDSSAKTTKKHLSLNKTDIFQYITYHTNTKTYYSDIKLDIYDKSKILLNMSGYLHPEKKVKCNITESKYYILIKNDEEYKKIINVLNCEDVIKYLKLCKYSGFNSRPVLESITYN